MSSFVACDALWRLEAKGHLARSACSAALRAHIAPLLAGGVLDWERRGAGKTLIVADVERFREHLDRTFPAPRGSVNHGSSRVRAVGESRSTKALGGLNEETVSVRAWSNGTLLREGGVVAAEEATRQFGIFTFVLRDKSPYTLTGPVALGENPDFFAYFETLNLRLPFCVFTNGRFSRRFLGWLAAPQSAEATFIHFGDYDPVGLDEYRRLRSALGARVSFYLPENLDALFRRHSDRDLLAKPRSQKLLLKLRSDDDPTTRRIIQLIDRHNAGLEQEALLIPAVQ